MSDHDDIWGTVWDGLDEDIASEEHLASDAWSDVPLDDGDVEEFPTWEEESSWNNHSPVKAKNKRKRGSNNICRKKRTKNRSPGLSDHGSETRVLSNQEIGGSDGNNEYPDDVGPYDLMGGDGFPQGEVDIVVDEPASADCDSVEESVLDDYILEFQEGRVGFLPIGTYLYAVQGWDKARREPMERWFHFEGRRIGATLRLICLCIDGERNGVCVHTECYREFRMQRFHSYEEVMYDDKRVVCFRRERTTDLDTEGDPKWINHFSVIRGNELEDGLQARAMVSYEGTDLGVGFWKCSKDGSSACAHKRAAKKFFHREMLEQEDWQELGDHINDPATDEADAEGASNITMFQRVTRLKPRSAIGFTLTNARRRITIPPEQLQEFGEHHVTGGLARIAPGIMVRGRGSHVYFEDGRTMLDFTCGIGVTNLGHCHPKVSKAASEQCLSLNHAQCSIAFHEPYLRLIEKLLPAMPHKSLDSFFFWNSGSEAVEASLKMARILTGKQNIICMQGAYHGRTFGALGVTRSKTIYGQGVAPLMPGAFPVPFPYWHQHGLEPSTSPSVLTAQSLYQLHLLLAQQTAPSETAAIIVEPVLGEGGYIPAPKEFLEGLREVCDKHNMLLIIDEVQSGFGRTGSWFFIEESGVRPDILIMAKGLANGFPLSGVVSRKELTDKLKPGSMGGTYAGNPVSCAAACAVADAMREENVLANVQARSEQLFSSLRSLQNDSTLSPYILDVRGRGLMIAMEFASSEGVGAPYDAVTPTQTIRKGLASKVAKRCVEKGMLLLTTSAYEVVRFIPALNISEQDMAKGISIFEEALREVVAEHQKA
ncbi:hypothetical protein V5O48_006573 [Marasmius crinis-equi]|uniref:4-aminobutyrate aminotransferase n=1 Tax=Marasmius crinis-equi TaxID=585013 RepID=A0ABR3FJ48_9AGAR